MNSKLEKQILKTIDATSSLMPLFKMGYSFFQVFDSCYNLEKEGLIEYDKNRRVLSSKGKKYLQGLKDNSVEIEPFYRYRINKMNVNDIYIP